ncbi:UNVERIFIED_CONTAM: Retinol dehydrogenase 11 [Trichonephila clavipes]
MDLLWLLLIIPIILILVLKLYVIYSAGVCRSTNLMEGKVIIVTGANSGIGFETAKDLAARKGRVILACRDVNRGQKAAESIIMATGNKNVVFRQLDLSSLSCVRKFASEIKKTEDRIDVLIHNAGMSPSPGRHLTEDNLELQFATKHFGPFLLTHLLWDLLKKSAPSRIIVVSSVTHLWACLDLNNLNCEKYTRNPYGVYCSTKLANVLFVRELAKRLQGTGVTVNALHPGGVKTAIARNAQWFIKYLIIPFIYFFLKDSKSGAQTSIYLAVSNEVKDVTGQYFVDCKPAWVSRLARNESKAKKLWDLTEKFTNIR